MKNCLTLAFHLFIVSDWTRFKFNEQWASALSINIMANQLIRINPFNLYFIYIFYWLIYIKLSSVMQRWYFVLLCVRVLLYCPLCIIGIWINFAWIIIDRVILIRIILLRVHTQSNQAMFIYNIVFNTRCTNSRILCSFFVIVYKIKFRYLCLLLTYNR